MSFWTPAQLERLQADLRAERVRLAADLRARLHDDTQPGQVQAGGRPPMADGPPGLHRYLSDELDAADAHEQFADDLAWLGHEAARLRDVDAALRRLAAGRYGWCADCGAPIPAERLLAQPAGARCLACQQCTEAAARGSAAST